MMARRITQLRPFRPTDIPGCVGWWCADDLAGLGMAAAIPTWTDRSGGNNHVAQSTVANRPLIQQALNRVVARYDATNDRLENTATSILAAGTPRTVIAVGQFGAASNGGGVVAFRRSLVCWCAEVFWVSDASVIVYTDADTGTNNAGVALTQAAIRAPWIATWQSTAVGAKFLFWFNGVSKAIAQVGNVTSETGTTGIAVGGRGDTVFPFNGDMGEVILFNRALNNSERARVERYLNERYKVF